MQDRRRILWLKPAWLAGGWDSVEQHQRRACCRTSSPITLEDIGSDECRWAIEWLDDRPAGRVDAEAQVAQDAAVGCHMYRSDFGWLEVVSSKPAGELCEADRLVEREFERRPAVDLQVVR